MALGSHAAAGARDGAIVAGQQHSPAAEAFLARFDGEFSSTTSIYSGSGMVRKIW
jgi:hypothetical protein